MKDQFIEALRQKYGNEIIASNLSKEAHEQGISYSTASKYVAEFKQSRALWNLDLTVLENAYIAPSAEGKDSMNVIEENYIPKKDPNYVAFGSYSLIKSIISSEIFYPGFITGLSGNGKTLGIEQACAHLKRELIRVNLTAETDEDDLIGGYRLVDGNTVWQDGPVIEAMKRGAILLLDEIDLATNKIMCLQSVLEGKGVFLKKIGMKVNHADGFNIFATANTKGKGSEDGRFVGTNVLNEAFLERFPVTFEQEYPSKKVEEKILTKLAQSLQIPMIGEHEDFIRHLCTWAETIRKTFDEGGVDEIISTRRLAHIIRAYKIFGKKEKAIALCLNRFCKNTQSEFKELYDKIDVSYEQANEEEANAASNQFVIDIES